MGTIKNRAARCLSVCGLLLLVCITLVACGGHAGNNAGDTGSIADKAYALSGQWYRHYTGTIAGKPVHLNLTYYSQQLRGTYYYGNSGLPIGLYNGEDTTKGDTSQYITEDAETERNDNNDYTNNPHWVVTFAGKSITGKWVSRDGKKMYDINLKEDYPAGTYQFDIAMADSSAGMGIATAVTSYQVSMPGVEMNKDDKYFLDTLLIRDLGCEPSANNDFVACMHRRNGDYLQAVFADAGTTDHDPADTTDHDAADSLQNHNESSKNSWVMYNEHGLVVFESLGYLYMGGAHGMYGSTYTCADVQGRRVWKLGDIMKVDTVKLMDLIELEARRQYKIKKGEKLSTQLLVDTIPVTDNIYFTESGITFNYGIYEIASYADGQSSFYIPFSKVMDMLLPDFKKRMGL